MHMLPNVKNTHPLSLVKQTIIHGGLAKMLYVCIRYTSFEDVKPDRRFITLLQLL